MNKVTLAIKLLVDIRAVLTWCCFSRNEPHCCSNTNAYANVCVWVLIPCTQATALNRNYCNVVLLRALFNSLSEMACQVEHVPGGPRPVYAHLHKKHRNHFFLSEDPRGIWRS